MKTINNLEINDIAIVEKINNRTTVGNIINGKVIRKEENISVTVSYEEQNCLQQRTFNLSDGNEPFPDIDNHVTYKVVVPSENQLEQREKAEILNRCIVALETVDSWYDHYSLEQLRSLERAIEEQIK